MKKHGDRQRKRIPRDGEAMCDILEFICGRLGIRLSFLEYVSEGVSMDDDGGFVDKVDACLDATNLDMDDIRQMLSDMDAELRVIMDSPSPIIIPDDLDEMIVSKVMEKVDQRLSSQDGEIQALKNALSDIEGLRDWVGKNHDSIEDLKQSMTVVDKEKPDMPEKKKPGRPKKVQDDT